MKAQVFQCLQEAPENVITDLGPVWKHLNQMLNGVKFYGILSLWTLKELQDQSEPWPVCGRHHTSCNNQFLEKQILVTLLEKW